VSMREPDRWMGVEMRHLAALEAIAEHSSFSRAAEQLGYTQSGISQQLATLERLVGERLVERPGGPRPVSLTPAGELLLRHARRVVDQLGAARADLEAWSDGQAGTLRVGTFHSAGAKILPAVVRRFAKAFPAVDLELTEAPDDEALLRAVEGGRLDLAFMMFPLVDGPFEATELLREPFFLLVAEDAAPSRPPSLHAIAQLPLIGYGPVRPALRPEARLPGVPRLVFRSNDDATIHGLVAAGVGAALLPRLSVDAGYPGVRAIALGSRLPPRRIGLAWHRDRDLPPAAAEFVAASAAAARLAGRAKPGVAGS
jgi:DNA-binding transcriptional LysR family regulator